MVIEAPELEAKKAQEVAQLANLEAELQKAIKGPRVEEKAAAFAAAQAAEERWKRLEEGFRDEEKKQAKSDAAAADADLKLAEEEYGRASHLYRQKMIAAAEYDQYSASYFRARGRADAARAKSDMMFRGSRPQEKAEAKALLDQARANYDLLKAGTRPEDIAMIRARRDVLARRSRSWTRSSPRRWSRPPRALIDVLPVRRGDVLTPNQTVVRILSAADLWVKVYVPETELGKVRLDQAAEVTVDSYPGRRFKGKVYYIASQSEFTPRNVQSIDDAGTRSSASRSASPTPPPRASSSPAWRRRCMCRRCEALLPVRRTTSRRRRPGAWGWDLRPTDARPVASALQHRKGLESLPQDRFRRQSQPPVEQRGVDAAEVDRPFQVAVDQLAEPGRFADQAGLGLRAGEEDRPRRPVIRAERSVLGGAPAELAEGQEQHAIGQPGGGQVVQEGADGPREVAEQLRLGRQLQRVRIVAGLDRVIDPRRRTRLDRSGDQLQMPAQLAIGVAGGGAAGPSGGIRELLGGRVGVRHRAVDERGKVITGRSVGRLRRPPPGPPARGRPGRRTTRSRSVARARRGADRARR